MRVSFIIPLFNCLPLTQAMLESLQATLPKDLSHEIIFVDDGSTDGTREWLQSKAGSNIRYILNEKNGGYAAANNRGAAEARGGLLVLLNNDLIFSRRWLEPMLHLHTTASVSGIVGNVQRNISTGEIDHAGIFINIKGKPEHDQSPLPWFRSARKVAATTGACLLISRALWERLSGFDEGFINGGEDVDLCLRARQVGSDTRIALRSIIFHHVSASPGRKNRDESNTRRLAEKWRDMLALFGARAWCEDYVARHFNAASVFDSPASSLAIFTYAHGLKRNPPSVAIAGMHLAIDQEMIRWRRLLDSNQNV